MATATWRTSTTSAPYVTLTVTQASQNVANNTSVVNYSLVLHRPSTVSSSASKSYSVTVNGSRVTGTTTIGGSGSKTIKTGSLTVPHNSDGTKSISFSFTLQLDITWSGSSLGTASASNTMTLTTIPRASSLTASNGVLGTAQTLTINRASSSFTHTINYKCGSYTGTITTKTSSTSVSYTPSLTFANTNTTGTTVSILLTLYTYSGNTLIGTTTKTISCSMPSSVKPAISAITIASTPSTHLTKYSGFVKGNTKAVFTITGTTSYGSAIASYKVVVSGTTYSKSTNVITTNNLTTSGSVTATITITDKRGRTASTTRTLTVLNYTQPVINTATAVRCDQDGTLNTKGSYCKLSYKITITALNNANAKNFSYSYKVATAIQYPDPTTLSNDTYVVESFVIFSANVSNGYNIILMAQDDFYTTDKALTLSAGSAIINWLANKLGMAVGKIAELTGYFDIGYKTIFRDYVYMDNYSDDEKDFYFQNSASRENKTYVNDGVYPHFCKFYGGNGESPVGIGMWDDRNMKRILAYNDNDIYSTMGVPLYFNNGTGFEVVTLSSSTITLESGFTSDGGRIIKWGPIVQFYAGFKSVAARAAGEVDVNVCTIPVEYRPYYQGSLAGGQTGPMIVGRITSGGVVSINRIDSALSANGAFILAGMWIADFTS